MRHLEEESFYPVVKIVVAESSSVILEHRHKAEFQFPPIIIEVRRTLEDIPCIKKQRVGILSAYLFH